VAGIIDPGHTFVRVSAIESEARTIWIVDAHRGDGKRFIVRADEKLTAFMELESAIRTASGTLKNSIDTVCRGWQHRTRVKVR